MSVQKTISGFNGGFYIDVVNESIATETIKFSQYELSRNNIRFKDVKSVKVANNSIIEAYIGSDGDFVNIEGWHYVCLPLSGSTSDLTLIFDFTALFSRKRIIFYYENKPSFWINMSHPL